MNVTPAQQRAAECGRHHDEVIRDYERSISGPRGHCAYCGMHAAVHAGGIDPAPEMTFPPPKPDEIIIWEDGVADGPGFDGYLDAWNGWYGNLTEALTDAPAGIGRQRTLHYGEPLMSEDELAVLGRLKGD